MPSADIVVQFAYRTTLKKYQIGEYGDRQEHSAESRVSISECSTHCTYRKCQYRP